MLLLLCEHFRVIVENKETIKSALKNEDCSDLEDGFQMQCALEKNLDYIVTRNINDFSRSQIKAVLPEEWVALYKRQKL